MPQILSGKEVSLSLNEKIAARVAELKAQTGRVPHLVAILVGNDGASQTYVGAKEKACETVGFDSSIMRFDASISQEELLKEIDRINGDDQYDGLIVQLPLPKHIDEEVVTHAIHTDMDVDGFHDINMGKLAKGNPGVKPATPYGITLMLKHYGIETSGKHVVVLGRSNIVGRPMSLLLSDSSDTGNATVTLCHSRTRNLAEYTRQADILVVALGKPEFVGADLVKPGAVVIDVGTTRVDDASRERGWRLTGDVNYAEVSPIASAITPVPGGVGPMTISGLMMNTLQAFERKVQNA
ncbi:MAG: bifunctional methylenetetrahydrofolate dehydrogenase/methenyltetrahydrofolate cyclohydrolase FolD [Bacteroidetes bacterium]|nr:bifunctional methylenetetrahydrofolate dehydrogenase/methenyltetrahydrofolate cyclohydrolase FolD [Bacteroidota bacterium]MDA0943221.1 bifunctional methylenetetrahydrofolate dehydrogenase/methenyltetrahydrofolate cyclohydrolase FolD [Bacteroidota bacterium]MDA1111190.1 bifunctional methylenetetrahydrofolate dehydrogenase/methenyltetrahydrofolate cyclohydrolase FolD [Bacteroidota bacterium]